MSCLKEVGAMAASAEPSPRSFRSPQHVVGIQAVNSPRDAGTSAQFVKSFPLPILNPGSGIVTGDFDGDALQPSPPRVATSGFSVRRVPFGRPQGIPLSPFSPAGSLVTVHGTGKFDSLPSLQSAAHRSLPTEFRGGIQSVSHDSGPAQRFSPRNPASTDPVALLESPFRGTLVVDVPISTATSPSTVSYHSDDNLDCLAVYRTPRRYSLASSTDSSASEVSREGNHSTSRTDDDHGHDPSGAVTRISFSSSQWSAASSGSDRPPGSSPPIHVSRLKSARKLLNVSDLPPLPASRLASRSSEHIPSLLLKQSASPQASLPESKTEQRSFQVLLAEVEGPTEVSPVDVISPDNPFISAPSPIVFNGPTNEQFVITSGNPWGRVRKVGDCGTPGTDSTPSSPLKSVQSSPGLFSRRLARMPPSPADSRAGTPCSLDSTEPKVPPSPVTVFFTHAMADGKDCWTNDAFRPALCRKGALIGQGSFGKVYRCLQTESGEFCAVKEIALGWEGLARGEQNEVALVDGLMREVDILSQLEHVNVVKYLGVSKQVDTLHVYMEYVSGGSLLSLVKEFGPMCESVMIKYLKQVMSGLHYLHRRMIVHGDLKSANIILTTSGVIKLADFGCAKVIRTIAGTPTAPSSEATFRTLNGTVPFMAPEVIKQSGFGRKADIWSLGCVVIEMATGSSPWTQFSNSASAMFHIASSDIAPKIPDTVSPKCAAFLRRCFQRDPQCRPSASELLEDPWLA